MKPPVKSTISPSAFVMRISYVPDERHAKPIFYYRGDRNQENTDGNEQIRYLLWLLGQRKDRVLNAEIFDNRVENQRQRKIFHYSQGVVICNKLGNELNNLLQKFNLQS